PNPRPTIATLTLPPPLLTISPPLPFGASPQKSACKTAAPPVKSRQSPAFAFGVSICLEADATAVTFDLWFERRSLCRRIANGRNADGGVVFGGWSRIRSKAAPLIRLKGQTPANSRHSRMQRSEVCPTPATPN